ncbi:uncharacterized protein N7479_011080 [Penicillium vulpinum]|uniref:Uncharacterized protein n=1 Tax=Penicillium vulpinum TaxID=29845 RepID=A0A1V6RSX3_9EURO|nr:uncharacterized protein N7479_011080 [Penicillium vulpinum]KAJ5952667.1 hypothetical protein N7479_011080 [Penicillium vulpinum]OQE04887.1 hypothetical protein PENVUL_c029G07423 [Penicillium vulpinum]
MPSDDTSRWGNVAVRYGGPVADLQITPQACVRCNVNRVPNSATSQPVIVVNEWISEDHLLWTLCAGLAATGLDPDWTRSFNAYHRLHWAHIQAMVQRAQGINRFLLDIRSPPIVLAQFIHHDGSRVHDYPITATSIGDRSRGNLLKLLHYVYHGGFSSTDTFTVALHRSSVTGSPPYAALGLPDPHAAPVPNLPPSDRPSSESGLQELLEDPERLTTPPPPYRGPSLAPPDWAP